MHFLEYGNSEEVLRTDCLPITDHAMPTFNHYHPNHYAQGPPPQQNHPTVIHQAMPAPPQQQVVPPMQQMHPPRNSHRDSRQVYVKK